MLWQIPNLTLTKTKRVTEQDTDCQLALLDDRGKGYREERKSDSV